MDPKRAGRGGNSIAGAALRRAGLVDGDVGMRDASGPSRSRGGRQRGGVGHTATGTNGSLQMQIDGQPSSARHARSSARQRSNPLGNRPQRRKSLLNVNDGLKPANSAAAIKNLTNSKAQAGGRIPGGGGIAFGGSNVLKSSNTIALLKRFVESRWNPAIKFLNLENMRTDPILVSENVKPPGTSGASKELGNVLWKLSSEMFPDVVTISLANNEFRSLAPVSSLPNYFPELQNLSLEGNELKWTKDLDTFSVRIKRLSSLKELLLIGNPVHVNAVAAGNEEGYRREILSRFPKLTMLDQKPVTPTESGFANLSTSGKSKKVDADAAQVPLRTFPLQNKPGFVDADAGNIMPNFLSKFFTLYDSDRSALGEAYAPAAQFSYCLNVSPPPRARAAGFLHTMPHQKELTFDKYTDLGNRNIMRVQATKSRHQYLHQGSPAIVHFISKLPRTSHPLENGSKFVADAWVIPNNVIGARVKGEERPDAVLFICVHGEYAEAPSQGIRSFDRTFLVAPVPPGSTASNSGWPCVILSDELVVRHYSSPAAWSLDSLPTGQINAAANTATATATAILPPVSTTVPAAAVLPAHLQNQPPAPGLNEQQHAMSLELASQTGLSYPFAVQCLQENGWDPNRAMSNFQALKASNAIPAEAFAQPPI